MGGRRMMDTIPASSLICPFDSSSAVVVFCPIRHARHRPLRSTTGPHTASLASFLPPLMCPPDPRFSFPFTSLPVHPPCCPPYSMEEFSNALRELGIGCDEAQAERLYRIVDANSSDRVSYVEFVNAFKVVDESAQQQEKSGDWRDNVVQQVASVLFQHRIQMRSAFRMFDLNNDGHIKYVFNAVAGMCGSRMK